MKSVRKIVMHTPHLIAIRIALDALNPRPSRWVICRSDEAVNYPGWTIICQHGDFVGLIERQN